MLNGDFPGKRSSRVKLLRLAYTVRTGSDIRYVPQAIAVARPFLPLLNLFFFFFYAQSHGSAASSERRKCPLYEMCNDIDDIALRVMSLCTWPYNARQRRAVARYRAVRKSSYVCTPI